MSLACGLRKAVLWKAAVTLSRSVNWVASFGAKYHLLCCLVTSGWKRVSSHNQLQDFVLSCPRRS